MLSSRLSGSGGDFDLGGLINSGLSFLGFSEGGVVPSTPYSRISRDSVPAMLTPGEVVVPVGASGMGNNTFNIDITGDISRQTRREIVGMMSDIASCVNLVNKDPGIR